MQRYQVVCRAARPFARWGLNAPLARPGGALQLAGGVAGFELCPMHRHGIVPATARGVWTHSLADCTAVAVAHLHQGQVRRMWFGHIAGDVGTFLRSVSEHAELPPAAQRHELHMIAASNSDIGPDHLATGLGALGVPPENLRAYIYDRTAAFGVNAVDGTFGEVLQDGRELDSSFGADLRGNAHRCDLHPHGLSM